MDRIVDRAPAKLLLRCLLACCAATIAYSDKPSRAQQPAAAAEPPLMQRQFDEYRPNDLPTPAEVKVIRGKVNAILQLGVFENDEQKQLFSRYFKYRIAEMTWIENLKELPKKRDTLKKQDLAMASRAPEPACHIALNQLLLVGLTSFASNEEYHPAARLNCVLLLGSLDSTEPGGNGQGAVPLAPALDKLIAIAADEKQIDAARVGALVGVARHARIGMSAGARKLTVDKLATIKGSSPEATRWLEHSAVRILGELALRGSEANQPAVTTLAQKVLSDKDATEWARCEAARALGMLDKSAFGASVISPLVTELGKLGVQICANCEDDTRKYTKDTFVHEFLALHQGLKGVEGVRGVAAGAPNEMRSTINELDAKFTRYFDMASDAKIQIDQLRKDFQVEGKSLEQWLNSKGVGDGKVAAGK